jgi:L-asparaginase II
LLGVEHRGYSRFAHPYQKYMRDRMKEFFGVSLENAPWGVDGCGIPTSAVPLKNIAQGMARLSVSESLQDLSSDLRHTGQKIRRAMQACPYAVGGKDSFCTRVIAATKGEALVKVGAEGVYGASFPSLGLGLAMKAEDGHERAIEVVLANFLRHLNIPFTDENTNLDELCSPVIKNWAGVTVGQIYLAESSSL